MGKLNTHTSKPINTKRKTHRIVYNDEIENIKLIEKDVIPEMLLSEKGLH